MPIENNDRDEKTVSSSKLMVNFLPRFQVGNYPFFTYFNKKKQALTEPDKQLEENLPPSLKKNRSLVQITRFVRIASIQSSTEHLLFSGTFTNNIKGGGQTQCRSGGNWGGYTTRRMYDFAVRLPVGPRECKTHAHRKQ